MYDANLTEERPTHVSHLECSATGERHEADIVHGLSSAGMPLLVRYDLEGVATSIDRDALLQRPPDLWRYRELLPVRKPENLVSLGEGVTPLIHLDRRTAAGGHVLVKDEGRLPAASFKARGIAVAVSMGRELGITRMAMSTNGNAGAALAAYGSKAGIETYVFCPADTPEVNVREIAMLGARVWRVKGLIDDCGRVVVAGQERLHWFDVSTLREPYRIEGKKTMGFELAEQLGWQLPDVIFYPTGGGTGLIGMWKAFRELEAIGWVDGPLPRMVAVQSTGCAPIVRAWEGGATHAAAWKNATTIAAGIRVPAALGDFLMLRAIRESGGFGIAVPDADIEAAQQLVAATNGLLLCPEGAATYAGYVEAIKRGLVGETELAVLFNCGNGLKYPMAACDRTLDPELPIDWAAIETAEG